MEKTQIRLNAQWKGKKFDLYAEPFFYTGCG